MDHLGELAVELEVLLVDRKKEGLLMFPIHLSTGIGKAHQLPENRHADSRDVIC